MYKSLIEMITILQSNPHICIQQMSEHIIHLYGVFNNMINEIPTRGDNAGWSYNMSLLPDNNYKVSQWYIELLLCHWVCYQIITNLLKFKYMNLIMEVILNSFWNVLRIYHFQKTFTRAFIRHYFSLCLNFCSPTCPKAKFRIKNKILFKQILS